MGSGKTSTSTQSVSIPPEVLARYNAVNARAEGIADTPFQAYSSDPNAFVAPMNQVQNQGVGVIQNAGNSLPQYFNAAASLTGAGAGSANPQELDIGKYYNPFTSMVAGNVYDTLRQQQQEEMSGQTANAIKSGAFGSDRAGLASANLARQQQLGLAGAMLPIFQQGYDQALGTAQQQQGVQLGAEQQNLARQLQAGSQFAGLGTAQQGAELGLGQALLGAGTVGQQTEQAGLSALYNQFLQEKGYPFQVAQFLANIAMGTGALSGSTTTTTQPAPFFSDEDEKTNIQKLGDGLYAYDYKADVEAARKNGTPMPPKRVGPMAQELEKKKPGLVIDVDDYKVVDPGHVIERAAGGSVNFDQDLISKILANQAGMYSGMYGQPGSPRGVSGTPGGKTYVPQGSLPVGKLATASAPPQQRQSGLAEAAQTGSQIAGLAKMAKSGYDWTKEKVGGFGASAPSSSGAPLDLGSSRERDRSLDEEQIGRGFAAGGSTDEVAPQGLYAPEGAGINIPDERQKNELAVAGKPPEQGKSGLGQVMDAAKSVAQIAAMFMADGGAVPSDDELVARTILSEAGRDRRGRINPEEALGIAAVINNRAQRRGLSPSDVVLEQGQFEPWAKPGGPNDPMKWEVGSPEYAQAVELWQRARGGEDPTKGATHFWGPASQRALGREAPAWGRSGGLDIGATRFHSVPGYGAGEGQERQPPAGLAPEPTAGRATPGIAGPGRGPQDPASAPFKTLFGGMFSDVEDPAKRSALTSENLWVPALAGLGSMLASRSPYLGNAIGEGLVGGTKAYGELNNAQHSQGLARANMESTMAGIADQSLKVVDGRLMIRYARPDGTYDYVSYQQYMALPPAERMRYKVDPRALSEAQKLAGASSQPPVVAGGGNEPAPRVASPSPERPPATAPAPANIPLPQPPGGPVRKVPSQQPFGTLPPSPTAMPHETGIPMRQPDRPTSVGGITLDHKTAEQAFLLTQQKAGYPSQDREREPDFFTPQDTIAREAEGSKQLLMPLVGALAALPRDASWATSGPVQSVVMPFVKTLNNLAQIAGLPPMKEVSTPSALQQEVEKLTAQMQRQDATASQQRAYAALQEMAKGIPGLLNSPEGQAKLIPQMLTNTQREIDRQNFFRAWSNAAGGPNNEYANYARLSSRDANRAFDDKYNESYYQAERQKLEQMFNQMVKDEKGQRLSLMAWLAQNGAQMGPEQKKQIVDRYGPGVLRYFGVQ